MIRVIVLIVLIAAALALFARNVLSLVKLFGKDGELKLAY